jgi:uracil-DNA glycosylase family 4
MAKRHKEPGNCPDCPFGSRTVGTRGPEDAKIVIVGESPGTKEVIEGVPFIGASGELLSLLLKEVGIKESELFITNAFRCLPPRSKDEKGNRVKDGVLNEACRACRGRLMKEIRGHPRDLIITMGSAAARSLTQQWSYSITKNRGQVVDARTTVNKIKLAKHGVLPTLHPAYILRNPSATPQLRSDLEKAKRLLSGAKYPKPIIKYHVLTSEREIEELIRKKIILHNGPNRTWRVVSDIESTGLHRYNDSFICNGFAFEHELSENGLNHVYIVTGKHRGELVKHLFRVMPSYVEWIWHNGKFDVSFLRAKGLPRSQVRVDHDTMLLSYCLDEIGGRHGLEQCIMDHLGLPAYKDKLSEYVGSGKKKKSYAEVPRPLLYEYNAEDVVYTGLLFRTLYPKICVVGKEHLRKVYTELLIPASNTLATIELNGMPIDQAVLAQSEMELEEKRKIPLATLRKIVGDPHYNPNSPIETLEVLKSLCKLKVHSTDEDTLKKFAGVPFVTALLEYRGIQKMLSTYLRAFAKYGARVHTSYLIHGTVTGRLSSSSPNMQNIPKEAIVRKHFRTRKGRVFVSFDYSQAELRSLAVLSGDKNLIELFRSGKDMHAAVAAQVYGEKFTRESEYLPDGKTENPVYNKYRRYAKTVNFGIVYGATEPTLMERLGITWDEAHALIIGWFKMFPDAKKYMDECRNSPVENRPLITVFGRQRRFYVVTDSNRHGQENEAGNFPHQSMCSDFTLDSAIQIDKIYHKRGLPGNAVQVNIIHDDNMFECDDDDEAILELAKIVIPIMERTPTRHGITELTFKADAKKGTVWSEMQKIKGL